MLQIYKNSIGGYFWNNFPLFLKTYVMIIYYKYRIYPAIRWGFVPLEWLQITKSVLWNFAIIPILSFLNNPKDLDPSFKTDLDLWDCFERKKTLSYNRRNTVNVLSRQLQWGVATCFFREIWKIIPFIPSIWSNGIVWNTEWKAVKVNGQRNSAFSILASASEQANSSFRSWIFFL